MGRTCAAASTMNCSAEYFAYAYASPFSICCTAGGRCMTGGRCTTWTLHSNLKQTLCSLTGTKPQPLTGNAETKHTRVNRTRSAQAGREIAHFGGPKQDYDAEAHTAICVVVALAEAVRFAHVSLRGCRPRRRAIFIVHCYCF
jgi:hypothetical protein